MGNISGAFWAHATADSVQRTASASASARPDAQARANIEPSRKKYASHSHATDGVQSDNRKIRTSLHSSFSAPFPMWFHHISAYFMQLQGSCREYFQEKPRSSPQRIHSSSRNLFSIRGMKIIGRQCELSHLTWIGRFDILGLQETKCTSNTMTKLAEGFLPNSSDNPHPGKEEHKETGLIFRNHLAPSLHKTYQGSRRWCGALFFGHPLPILALSRFMHQPRHPPTKKRSNSTKKPGMYSAKTAGHALSSWEISLRKVLQDPGLPRHIGPNIFLTWTALENHSEEVLENRELFP